MLIQFTVGNYRSFKEPVTFSMLAARVSARAPEINENNTFEANDDVTLLTSAGIYGANASGKSNLIKALRFMRRFVQDSSKATQAYERIPTTPFHLHTDFEKEPSFFEIVFILEDIVYRYGFEVGAEKVETEWLFYTPHTKEARLFIRDGEHIQVSRAYKGGQPAVSLTRPNALYLSVTAQFNQEIAMRILGWFSSLKIVSGLGDLQYKGFTTNLFYEDPVYRSKISALVNSLDVGIKGLEVENISARMPTVFAERLTHEIKELIQIYGKSEEGLYFKTKHDRYNEAGLFDEISFDLEDESTGTQKLLDLAGPILYALQNGQILVIDEIEARLHTRLTRKLIGLFNDRQTNPKHAQLVFATHDTNLLSRDFLRRDQIWFIEKDEYGASHLYSLAELKVRNDRDYEKDYLLGRYGGIPILNESRNVIIQPEDEG